MRRARGEDRSKAFRVWPGFGSGYLRTVLVKEGSPKRINEKPDTKARDARDLPGTGTARAKGDYTGGPLCRLAQSGR